MTERFHFGLPVAELLGDAERLLIPGVGLGIADPLLLALAGAHEGAHGV